MAKGESLGGDLVPRSPTAKGKDPFSRKTEWDLGTRMNTMNTDSTDIATFWLNLGLSHRNLGNTKLHLQ